MTSRGRQSLPRGSDTAPYGHYSTPRKCEHLDPDGIQRCPFVTTDRAAYWAHVIDEHDRRDDRAETIEEIAELLSDGCREQMFRELGESRP